MSAIRGLFLVVVTALLLAGATVAAGYTSQPLTEMAQAEPLVDRKERVRLPQPQVSVPEVIDHELPDWLPLAALCAAVLAAVVVLILVARVVRRRVAARRSNTAPATGRRHRMADEGQLLAAVDAGLADLSDTDSDPRRAVIACWLRLEEAAAVAGTPRHASDTATDLVVRLLRSHQVSEPVLAGLAEVYLLARFTTHTVDTRMRDQARTALHRMRTELASQTAPEPTPVGAN